MKCITIKLQASNTLDTGTLSSDISGTHLTATIGTLLNDRGGTYLTDTNGIL